MALIIIKTAIFKNSYTEVNNCSIKYEKTQSTINVTLIGQSIVRSGLEQSSLMSLLYLADYVVRKFISDLHCCWDERSAIRVDVFVLGSFSA